MPVADSTQMTGGIPCHFFLTNYSVNGTIVNGTHLQKRGEQIPLHSGDIIAFARLISSGDGYVLAPFLEFRFDLSGSILTDADAFADDECPVTGKNAPVNLPSSRSFRPPRAPSPGQTRRGSSPTTQTVATSARRASSPAARTQSPSANLVKRVPSPSAPIRRVPSSSPLPVRRSTSNGPIRTPVTRYRRTIVNGPSGVNGNLAASSVGTSAALASTPSPSFVPPRQHSASTAGPGFISPCAEINAITDEPLCGGGSCTSFVGQGLEPLFVLEAGGTAVREGLLPEYRRIVHGPPTLTNDSELEPCPTLLLGRAQQQAFWQRLLIEEAFNALSRQQFQIEVRNTPSGATSSTSFCVRNLSVRNPTRVCRRLEDGAVEAACPMECRECRNLVHGDAIVVNPNRGNTLWLVFTDLQAGRAKLPSTLGHIGCSGTFLPPTSRGPGGLKQLDEDALESMDTDVHEFIACGAN
eukprot:TRINITY_DN7481_c0_g2_i2.p1 TRINITY_DN7481_c0_g2~~TRINITY_DN7481_c0_g2_i2.p1  ORF type:complete len:468 (-),score=75.72 TRINITY_DN7481_c0_g2_i2:339-1742(-)